MSSSACVNTWGLALAVLNDKAEVSSHFSAILAIGIYAIYGTFIYAIASAYKLWTYKTMRDILLMDMERVEYVWNKIQDINTARALAKRDNTYFMVEEKLWWDLHSIFRDPAKLYAVTSRPSSVLVIVGLWEEGKGRMIHTVQIEMSFMARVCDLRDTASRQLRSRHLRSRMLALHKYDRWKNTKDQQLCASEAEISQARTHVERLEDMRKMGEKLTAAQAKELREAQALVAQGDDTLWNAGVMNRDTLCLCPPEAAAQLRRQRARSTPGAALVRTRSVPGASSLPGEYEYRRTRACIRVQSGFFPTSLHANFGADWACAARSARAAQLGAASLGTAARLPARAGPLKHGARRAWSIDLSSSQSYWRKLLHAAGM